MSLNTTSNTTVVQGNGATTVFNYGFLMDSAAHAVIIFTDVNGVPTTLNAGQYAITGVGNPNGGTVTYNPAGVPIPNGTTLTISRQVPYVQGSSIDNQGNFYPTVVEAALDYLTMQTQQINQLLSRVPALPLNLDATLFTMSLPTPVANAAIGWDATGKKLANVFTAGGLAATAFGQLLMGTVDKIAAQVLLGGGGIWCGNAGGTANAQTLTPTTAIAAYNTGDVFVFKATATNNGATTINISGKGAIAAQSDGGAMVGGEIQNGKWYTALYDGAAFQVSRWRCLPVGTDNQALLADSSVNGGLRFVTLGAGSVRQSVQQGVVDANGYANFLTTGSGLRPGLSATARALIVAFASGFGQAGAQDLVSTISADVSDPLAANLPASNTSFVRCDYSSPFALTYGSVLVPPDYGYKFDQTRGSLLNFEGANGSTTFLDDFGNTWTASGNAQIATAQFKFGSSSGVFDGTGDWITSTNFTTFGEGSWEISAWFRFNALPGVGARQTLWGSYNGVLSNQISLFNNAGTLKLEVFLGSDGSTANIANGTVGTNTVWAINTWYKFRLVFDALAGTYKVYFSNNGAAESADISVSSSLRLCASTQWQIGANGNNVNNFNGWIDGFRFVRAATNTSTETPSGSAPSITDYPYHWFSIPEMKMYEITAASGAAGVNPTLTQRSRCFLGEADTGAATVSAVRSYAIRCKYRSALTAMPAAGIATNFNTNLGVKTEIRTMARVVCVTQGAGEVHSAETDVMNGISTGAAVGGCMSIRDRNAVQFIVNGNGSGVLCTMRTDGLLDSGLISNARYRYYVEAERSW